MRWPRLAASPACDAAARVAPTGAGVTVDLTDDTVTVVVEARIRVLGGNLPVITVRSAAVAAREPAVVGAVP